VTSASVAAFPKLPGREIPGHVECKSCALLLARLVCGRHWWFPLLREPLVRGMCLLAWWHGIDAREYPVGNRDCAGCIRFMKAGLELSSPLFRFLNGLVGEHFSALRNARLSTAELELARRVARESMEQQQKLPPQDGTAAAEPAAREG